MTFQNPTIKNLDEALSFLENNYSKIQIAKFKALSESEAIQQYHDSWRLLLVNSLKANEQPKLIAYFNGLGISSPEDMANIVLVSFHRKLNKREIKLSDQIQAIKTYWESILTCDNNEAQIAYADFANLKENVLSEFYMEVDSSGGLRNAVIQKCNRNKLLMRHLKHPAFFGYIVQKFHRGDTMNVFVKVRYERSEFSSLRILLKPVKKGDLVVIPLKGLIVKQ